MFYEKLSAAADFLPLHVPQCNIVVFRHVPAALATPRRKCWAASSSSSAAGLIESGEFYIVSTKLDGMGALRVTIINPLTGRSISTDCSMPCGSTAGSCFGKWRDGGGLYKRQIQAPLSLWERAG